MTTDGTDREASVPKRELGNVLPNDGGKTKMNQWAIESLTHWPHCCIRSIRRRQHLWQDST